MREFFKTIPGKLCIGAAAFVLLAAIALSGYTLWHYLQPKFQDVTIELGEEFPAVSEFLTPLAKKEKATMLTAKPDISKAGDVQLEFAHGNRKQTVTLSVKDTTAPAVTFRDLTVDIDAQVKPEDFVAEVTDLSPTTVSFAADFDKPQQGGTTSVEVVVTDDSGNATKNTCSVTYQWMHEKVT